VGIGVLKTGYRPGKISWHEHSPVSWLLNFWTEKALWTKGDALWYSNPTLPRLPAERIERFEWNFVLLQICHFSRMKVNMCTGRWSRSKMIWADRSQVSLIKPWTRSNKFSPQAQLYPHITYSAGLGYACFPDHCSLKKLRRLITSVRFVSVILVAYNEDENVWALIYASTSHWGSVYWKQDI